MPRDTIEINSDKFINIQQNLRKSFSKQQIQMWMKRSERRVFLNLAVDWLVIVLAFGAFAGYPTWWLGLAAFFIIGCAQYHLFILGHDGLHSNLSDDRSRNDFIARWLIYAPMFMGFSDARRNHLEHHRTLGTAKDPDRYIHTLGNKNSRFKFLLFCSGLATFGRTVLKVTPFGKMFFPTDGKIENDKSTALKDYIIERIPVLIWQIVIFSAFFWFGVWWAYFLLWVAPIYFLVFLPDELRAFCDHAVPLAPDEAADPKRLVTFKSNWLEKLFLSPHNMNYHAEHHLWVGVPYYNLPKVHEAIKDQPHITIRNSYAAFLLTILKSLPIKAK